MPCGRPQEITLRDPNGVILGSSEGVDMGRPLTLHQGPFEDIYRMSTSLRRNFAEWVTYASIVNEGNNDVKAFCFRLFFPFCRLELTEKVLIGTLEKVLATAVDWSSHISL